MIFDPKADLIEGFLDRLDPAHHDRVVVLDTSDADRLARIDPLNPSRW